MVERDEEPTVRRLRENSAGLVRPAVEEHGGRTVALMGDGALFEFASAADAVRCALAVQAASSTHQRSVNPQDRHRYRIGIPVGDDDDIRGGEVNVAARLEAPAHGAPPSGVKELAGWQDGSRSATM